jgi:hypothetical protein
LSDTVVSDRFVRPTFLYIGASKSGSSWIYEILREHPDVFVPEAKDLQFFNSYYDKGLDWYFGFFAEGRDKQAIGELSHDYFLSSETAARIYKALPEVKLVCCLREVVDRMISHYVYARSVGSEYDLPFETFAETSVAARPGEYKKNLAPFYDLFPSENILVQFYDDLKADSRRFCAALYGFIGVDPTFDPPSLQKKVNVAHHARVETVARLAYRAAQAARKLGLANLVGVIKRNKATNAILYKSAPDKPEISLDTRRRIRQRYAKDYDELSKMIGQPLPSAWLEEDM